MPLCCPESPVASNVQSRSRAPGAALLFLSVIMVGTGCAGFRGKASSVLNLKYPVEYALAIHLLADQDEALSGLVGDLPAGDTRRIRVRSMPVLSSANVVSAREIPLPDGKTGVMLELDPHGAMLWMQLRTEHAGGSVAVAVDGVFRFALHIAAAGVDPDRVLLSGPWDTQEARKVVELAARNYHELNRP